MAARVIIEMFLASEAFAANGAIVRFVGSVTFHVALERGSVGEDVKAHGASEHRAA